jgi:23S rRNA pseudouridine1911/1915/1917 synthase
MSPEPIPLEIIHEDEHLMVIVKPAGMLVHPTMSAKSGTLANALTYHLNRPMIEEGTWNIENLARGPDESTNLHFSPKCSILNSQRVIRPGIVHRLDRATSGLMVIATTQRALAVLSRHFRKRLVEKRYLAWVHGVVQEEDGVISAPIGRDPEQRPHWRVIESGKPAETRFKVLDRMRYVTLLELEPVTGRTNQLRIHWAHIGHPIVGDEMHGNCESRVTGTNAIFVANVTSQTVSGVESAIRLCLHAWKLAFHHPATGEWLEFTTPVPDDITTAIEQYTRAE